MRGQLIYAKTSKKDRGMRSITRDSEYNGFDLSTSRKRNGGHYVEILRKINALFDHMTMRHNKVFYVSLVAKFSSEEYYLYGRDNRIISMFMENLILYYKRNNYDPKYLWVREESRSFQHHYHIMILFNGNRIQNGYGVLRKCNELWSRYIGMENASGLIHLCNTERYQAGGIMIRRNDPDCHQVVNQCFNSASYLAKCYSKGEAPMYVNEYGSSRVPLAK